VRNRKRVVSVPREEIRGSVMIGAGFSKAREARTDAGV
jgi:hypothetical protein